MRLPSRSVKRYFWLASAAGVVRSITCGKSTLKCSASALRSSFGMFVIASNASTPRTYIQSSICLTRNGGETIVPSACSRRGGARSYRFVLPLLVVTGSSERGLLVVTGGAERGLLVV